MNKTIKWTALVGIAILVGILLAGAVFIGGNWQKTISHSISSPIDYNRNAVSGPSMMGAWVDSGGQSNETLLMLEEAWEAAEAYIAGDPNLEIAEVMAFTNNYYAQAREIDSGRYALELLIDSYTGAVYPEMGPNMMWNTRYGHMGNTRGGMMGMMGRGYSYPSEGSELGMTFSPEEAVSAAQAYLDLELPSAIAIEPAAFYGYYTLHVLRDGEIVGMLSVHGTTGQVWYHTWHGDFTGMIGEHE